MQIKTFEVFPIRAAYTRHERSSVVDTGGVSNVLVRLTTDDGLVGWGEATAAASTESVRAALQAMAPHVVGCSPWHREAIAQAVLVTGRWRYQVATAAFAFAGIDMALWDLCGRACGQPVVNLLGGPLRASVNYFYYLQWGDDADLEAQCADGLRRGYTVFYLKVGVDPALDEHRLGVLRATLGAAARIRIDANQAWTPGLAARLIPRWHQAFDLDLVEGPVLHHPPQVMAELRQRVPVPLCADEGLRGEEQAYALVEARAADVLCLSPYDVGSLRRAQSLAWAAHRQGQQICKHTWGELGIYAAAMQHLLLALPNASDGHQQTAQMLAEDVLQAPIPITDGPTWGAMEAPGLGVEVDAERVQVLHEAYLRDGEYPRARPS